MTEELKPCPFCGSEAANASYASCDCCGKAYNAQVCCGHCTATVSHLDTDDEAIAAWNTRAESAEVERLRARVAELEAALAAKTTSVNYWRDRYAEELMPNRQTHSPEESKD